MAVQRRQSERSPLLQHADSNASNASNASSRSSASSTSRRLAGAFPLYRSRKRPHLNFAPIQILLIAAACVGFGVVVIIQTNNLRAVPRADPAVSSAAHGGSLRSDETRAHGHRPSAEAAALGALNAANCSTLWIDQKIDHYAWLPATAVDPNASSSAPAMYNQRYLLNRDFWNPANPRAPVFFYTGNEGDVTLYANHTGLIWENARDFEALIVFAEHRYYGESLPFGQDYMKHLRYLNHEQALADYTELIYHLQQEYDAKGHPVIAFGGSYGGMLSAWFRMKYPSIVHGAIAASAPIFGFQAFPSFKGEKYWQIVTQNAEPLHGASPNCAPNVRKAWPVVFEYAKTNEGREALSQIFRLCEPLADESQGEDLAMAVMVAFDTMAMGNFPYPSSYLTGGSANLPAWPVRAACTHLAPTFSKDEQLLEALRDAANVFNNATGDLQCYKLPKLSDFDGVWDYQWCTEMLPQETYFDSNGHTDMFWPRTVSMEAIKSRCASVWNTTPDPTWIRVSYGDEMLRGASNIAFSNGNLDPWSSGGVHNVSANVPVSVIPIADGAHHLDLFFSHPDDPESVKVARAKEVELIHAWIDEYVSKVE